MKVTVYGEWGQYDTNSAEIEVETAGTPRALAALTKKWENEWAHYGDNWSGWLKARVGIYVGSLSEFQAKYPDHTTPHYITGATHRALPLDDYLGHYYRNPDATYFIIP